MKNKMKNRVIEMKDLCLLWLFLFLLGGIPAGATTISDDELASGTEELIAFPGLKVLAGILPVVAVVKFITSLHWKMECKQERYVMRLRKQVHVRWFLM